MSMIVDGVSIGHCLYGVDIGIVDYSRKERDVFGEITLIERGYTDLVSFPVEIATADAEQIKNYLSSKRAVSATYIGDSSLSVTHVIGYLNEFEITLDNWKTSTLLLEVEGEVHT
jgi:hypothetical protein